MSTTIRSRVAQGRNGRPPTWLDVEGMVGKPATGGHDKEIGVITAVEVDAATGDVFVVVTITDPVYARVLRDQQQRAHA